MSPSVEKKDTCQDVTARQMKDHWINLILLIF